ncbi:MAG: hypothetical protein ACT6FF_03910 [Methanosarcinaceae archaeon]
MPNDTKTIPLVNRNLKPPADNSECGTECSTCSSTGCAGGLGIKSGSNSDVVYRNIFIFTVIILTMIMTSFLIIKILTVILE